MFHDELIPAKEKPLFHEAYKELANAVRVCRDYLRIVFDKAAEQTHNDGQDTHAIPMMMLFDFIEVIDGLFLLIRSGSAANCTPLLRTGLELELGLGYLFESKQEYKRRALSYEYSQILYDLECYQRMDSTTAKGQELQRLLKSDELADVFDATSYGIDAAKQRQEIESELSGARYAEVHSEYQRMKSDKKRINNWFCLWNGPMSLRELAIKLKRVALYEGLYRNWSATTHGEASMKRIQGTENGRTLFRAIRSPQGLPSQTRHACNLALSVICTIIDNLATELHSERERYYTQQIKPALFAIEKYKDMNR